MGEKTYVNVKERRKYNDSHYLKSSKEMNELFEDLPDALENNFYFPLRISYRPKNSHPVLPDIHNSEIPIARPPFEQSCAILMRFFEINDNTDFMFFFDSKTST